MWFLAGFRVHVLNLILIFISWWDRPVAKPLQARNLTHTYSLLVAALIMKTIFALGVASSVVVGCLAWSEYALRIITDYLSPTCQLQT